MKIIIASAGGGHFSPVLSVIKRLSKAEVIVIGRKYGIEGDRTAESLEYKICKSLDLRFISLTTGRLQRKFTKYTLLSLAKIPFGIIQSFTFLIKENLTLFFRLVDILVFLLLYLHGYLIYQ